MTSPYANLPPERFWRSGVSDSHPLTVENLYKKKFSIEQSDKIATAGSCFAQHVSNYLQKNGFSVMDVEPPPPMLSDELAKAFGYKIYSARYGNIYTVRQLLQLAQDAMTGDVRAKDVWEKDGRFYDALRPNIEQEGFDSAKEVLALRKLHLAKVKELFTEMDVFIFTLGLTEAWVDKRSGRVYPTAPGTIAGDFDPEIYEFHNFEFQEIYDDFLKFCRLIRQQNKGVKIILTVSPVPLTATASDDHILLATTYSKSVLRAVAGALSHEFKTIDYFPSYEMIASPWSKGFFYEANLRSVNSGGVASVMRVFFDQHAPEASVGGKRKKFESRELRARNGARKELNGKRKKSRTQSEDEVVCEDVLLEAFGR